LLASPTKRVYQLSLGLEFHGHVVLVFKLRQFAIDAHISDLSGARLMAPGYICDMDQSNKADVLRKFLDQIPFGNLLVAKVVKAFDAWMVYFTTNVESLRHRGQVISRIFFLIDVFKQQSQTMLLRNFGPPLQRLNTRLVLLVAGCAFHPI